MTLFDGGVALLEAVSNNLNLTASEERVLRKAIIAHVSREDLFKSLSIYPCVLMQFCYFFSLISFLIDKQ